MDLRHLQTFQTIVQEGSFSAAADKLLYAQSTITMQVQQLEAELGVKLFVRNGKHLQLSEAGRLFQEQAALIVSRMELLQHRMKDWVSGEAGHIRFGAIEPAASLQLTPILIDYLNSYPKVQATLEVGGHQRLADGVVRGHLDFAIATLPVGRPELKFELLFYEEMCFLVPENHGLAKQQSLTLQELGETRLLMKEPGCIYREFIETALANQPSKPYLGLEIGSIEGLKQAVQHGWGVAIVPSCSVSPPPAGTKVLNFKDTTLKLPVGVLTRVEQQQSAKIVENLLNRIRGMTMFRTENNSIKTENDK
jgi:LysR family transcriptional regulator, regulator of the ytmI operon